MTPGPMIMFLRLLSIASCSGESRRWILSESVQCLGVGVGGEQLRDEALSQDSHLQLVTDPGYPEHQVSFLTRHPAAHLTRKNIPVSEC